MSRPCFWCGGIGEHSATWCPHYRRPPLPPGVYRKGNALMLDSIVDAMRELERNPLGNDEPLVAQPDPMPPMPAPRFLRECSGSCLSRGCNCEQGHTVKARAFADLMMSGQPCPECGSQGVCMCTLATASKTYERLDKKEGVS